MRQNAKPFEVLCRRVKRRVEKQGDLIALARQIELAVSFAYDGEQMVGIGTLRIQRDRDSQMDGRCFEASTFCTLPSSFETRGVSSLAVPLQLSGT